jgi:hypothetical protein
MPDKQRDRMDESSPRRDDDLDRQVPELDRGSEGDLNRGIPELDREGDQSPQRRDNEEMVPGKDQGPTDPDSAESDVDRDDTVTD